MLTEQWRDSPRRNFYTIFGDNIRYILKKKTKGTCFYLFLSATLRSFLDFIISRNIFNSMDIFMYRCFNECKVQETINLYEYFFDVSNANFLCMFENFNSDLG